MEIQTVEIKLKRKDDEVQFEPLGDLHIGNINFDNAKLLRSIERIGSEENRFWIGMGDYAECIFPTSPMNDPRFNIQTVNRGILVPDEQFDYIRELLNPIKEKCWGLHSGNHETSFIQKTGHDYVRRDLCNPLKARYLGLVAFTTLRFTFRGKPLDEKIVFSAHGNYGGMRIGGTLNRIEDLARSFDADIYLMGHTHAAFVVKGNYIAPASRNSIVEAKRLFCSTGGFLRGYVPESTSYIEKNLRSPLKTGTITVTFVPATGDVFGHE